MYCSGFSSKCVGVSCGVDIFILLNLCSLKNVLFLPTLFCEKNTCPGSSITINNASIKNTGDKMIKPKKESTISIALFKNLLYIIHFLSNKRNTRNHTVYIIQLFLKNAIYIYYIIIYKTKMPCYISSRAFKLSKYLIRFQRST